MSSGKLTENDELDFPIRVSGGVSGCIDGAVIHPIVPPHHLVYDQVSL